MYSIVYAVRLCATRGRRGQGEKCDQHFNQGSIIWRLFESNQIHWVNLELARCMSRITYLLYLRICICIWTSGVQRWDHWRVSILERFLRFIKLEWKRHKQYSFDHKQIIVVFYFRLITVGNEKKTYFFNSGQLWTISTLTCQKVHLRYLRRLN